MHITMGTIHVTMGTIMLHCGSSLEAVVICCLDLRRLWISICPTHHGCSEVLSDLLHEVRETIMEDGTRPWLTEIAEVVYSDD